MIVVSNILQFIRNSLKSMVLHMHHHVQAILSFFLNCIKFVVHVPWRIFSVVHQITKYFGWGIIGFFREIGTNLKNMIKAIHMDILEETLKYHRNFLKTIVLEIVNIIYSLPTFVFNSVKGFMGSLFKTTFVEILSSIKQIGLTLRNFLINILAFVFALPFKVLNFILKLPAKIKVLYLAASLFLRFGKLFVANSVSSFYSLFLLLNQLTNLLHNLASFTLNIYEMLLKFD